MPTVDELFDRFRGAYRADEDADPRAYLQQVTGAERRELAALIDAFLAADPGRTYDAAEYERFRTDPLTRKVAATIEARLDAESWAQLLPAARHEARISRSALVSKLAAALGVSDRRERVADYYHEMETGALPGHGVSTRVLEALSSIVGVPVERLRAAGRVMAPPAGGAGPVFARSSPAAWASQVDYSVDLGGEPWDEVDQLFRGGD
jgi:hypothetical protein